MGKRLTIALAVFALIAIPSAAYVGGYFWLGNSTCVDNRGKLMVVREYPHKWQAQLFVPAARIEAKLGGDEVDRVILRMAGKVGGQGVVFVALGAFPAE